MSSILYRAHSLHKQYKRVVACHRCCRFPDLALSHSTCLNVANATRCTCTDLTSILRTNSPYTNWNMCTPHMPDDVDIYASTMSDQHKMPKQSNITHGVIRQTIGDCRIKGHAAEHEFRCLIATPTGARAQQPLAQKATGL